MTLRTMLGGLLQYFNRHFGYVLRPLGTKAIGVDCAEFDHRPHPHVLIVKYDPGTVRGMQILNMVHKIDPAASMVGL